MKYFPPNREKWLIENFYFIKQFTNKQFVKVTIYNHSNLNLLGSLFLTFIFAKLIAIDKMQKSSSTNYSYTIKGHYATTLCILWNHLYQRSILFRWNKCWTTKPLVRLFSHQVSINIPHDNNIPGRFRAI